MIEQAGVTVQRGLAGSGDQARKSAILRVLDIAVQLSYRCREMKPMMKLLLLTIACAQSAVAGGSISWDDVRARIAKSDPEIVKVIENTFVVNQSGGGVRLGPHFGERQGERISPYEFGVEEKKTKIRYVLVIRESEDYEFTGRFCFLKEHVAAENPASNHEK